MRKIIGGMLLVSAMAVPWSAEAALIHLENPDFENGIALSDGAFAPGHQYALPGWSASGGSGTGRWNPNSSHFIDEAAHGAVGFAAADGLTTTLNAGMMAQTVLGETLRANTRYTLTLDVGNYFGNSDRGYNIGLISQFGTQAGQILAQSVGVLGPQGSFKTVQLVFETDSQTDGIGKAFTIALSSAGQAFGGGAAFDNVRLEATSLVAVPEPATWATMIAGFALIGMAARRRQPLTAAAA